MILAFNSYIYRALACLFACCICALLAPPSAFAVTSEEMFAEAESIMRQIDVLQTNINEEYAKYDAALAEQKSATDAASEAQARIDEEQARMEQLQEKLSACATNMYKTGGSTSFIDVMLGSSTFDEFLNKWDAFNSISNQGATLVQRAKTAKAAQESAKAEYEQAAALASEKMAEAERARTQIESNQAALREEAEKISKEAAELQAQEELEREAARLAAAAAEAAEKARAEREAAARKGTGSLEISGSEILQHPCPEGTPSSPFGWRDFNGGSFHMGYDIAAREGTPYCAAESGTVIHATNDGGYNGGAGNWVVIAHGNGMVTKYMHSSEVYVKVGDRVERGDVIGAIGNTGQSFGAHLHFQVEFDGVAVDPTAFL